MNLKRVTHQPNQCINNVITGRAKKEQSISMPICGSTVFFFTATLHFLGILSPHEMFFPYLCGLVHEKFRQEHEWIHLNFRGGEHDYHLSYQYSGLFQGKFCFVFTEFCDF